jgi:hypothetical protein
MMSSVLYQPSEIYKDCFGDRPLHQNGRSSLTRSGLKVWLPVRAGAYLGSIGFIHQ